MERRFHLSQGYVAKILRGERPLTARHIAEIATITGSDEGALRTGQAVPESPPVVEREDDAPEPGAVRTYRTGGGDRWGAVEEPPAEYTPLPQPRDLLAFKVQGPSMEPVAREGQTVLALKNVLPKDGDLAHIELADGTVTFKRVYLRGPRWLLVPVNPAFDPMDVPATEIRRAMKVWGVKF